MHTVWDGFKYDYAGTLEEFKNSKYESAKRLK